MSPKDVSKIKVGKNSIGIIGLKNTLEAVEKYFAAKPEDEIQAELLKRLSRGNYIPDANREEYGRAFLREFNKYFGRPYEEENFAELEIKVLGQGCTQCDRLEQELMQVMAEFEFIGDIEHVRDIKEIGKYGVMGMPALIINGKIKSVGRVPPKNQLIEWLKAAKEK
ncbi:MAG: thioredoxin family protein [Thermodesulfobacteriota bacterium]|nr:thioredoxin family protein [Thermodesulfobacteriota bacterium]